ncbi:MAG TPA: putative monovalent cation/H+ antiporter subunit A [Anaerolineae bacterium]|nr:putative monovalent cation/H+ antiporter subunit A [Anaerolineae bacterium]
MARIVATQIEAAKTASPSSILDFRLLGWLLALLPAGLAVFFASFAARIAGGEVLTVAYPWIPSLGVNLSFYLDGLSLIFTLLISGIGTLVVIYAGGYLAGHPQLGRFYLYILLFMVSMLGLVLANNLITLFVFWELTSLTSYLLIGFNHRQAESRASALQALLVTGGGGLALLVGLILLGQVGGSWELSTLLAQAGSIQADPLYLPLLGLILLGALTKSAQFPFHFWLPNAMAAPTPVSAFLHSATMVKAGVYLLARLSPVIGGTLAWQYSLTAIGGVTMLLGAHLAWQQTDLKRILAYSTISALGTLVLLLGLSTPLAVKAAIVFLIVHSLYKGALFMVAGAVDHETGTRDVAYLGGLRTLMPVTFIAAALAALSMAGALPLFIGYIGKKLIYEATLGVPSYGLLLTGLVLVANAMTVVAAGLIAVKPFFGPTGDSPKHAHEAPASLWLGPLALAVLGLGLVIVIELVPNNLLKPLVGATLSAITVAPLIEVKLAAWSGFNTLFFLSLATLGLGLAAYLWRAPLLAMVRPANLLAVFGPERGYALGLKGLLSLAAIQTRWLQHGYLRLYLLTILSTTVALGGYVLLASHGLGWPALNWEIRLYEGLLVTMILIATVVAVLSNSRLATIAALGLVGYGLALIFVFFGAPDLAMTQLAIETLTVILLVLVLYRLPAFERLSSAANRLRDGLVALAVGGLVTGLMLAILARPLQSSLTTFFAESSVPLAQGRNIVNVILVDFRALDTLGEITVLAVAALGVYALLKSRQQA